MLRALVTLLSLAVPGSGQLLQGRVRDGLLFLWAAFWFHALSMGAVLSAYPQVEDRVLTFAVGALGVPRGLAVPAAVIFTGVALTLHVWSARDAWRQRSLEAAARATAS